MDFKAIIKTSFLLILIAFFACNNNSNDDCNSKVKEYDKLGQGSKTFRDTLNLLEVISKDIDNNSKCKELFLYRAEIFFQLDSSQLALNDYLKVINIDPKNVYSLYRCGLLYNSIGKYDSALYYLDFALESKKVGGLIVDYPQNGNMKNEKNKYDIPAINIYFSQAESYYYIGNLEAALFNYNYCIKNEYQLGQCYLFRGGIYIELKSNEKGCEDFRNSLKYGNLVAKDYLKKYCGE